MKEQFLDMQDSLHNYLDSSYLVYLKTLQELHEKKQQLQACLSSGYLSMSKARYVMGVQRVSKLHYSPVMKAATTVDLGQDEDKLPIFDVFRKNEMTTTKEKEAKTVKKRITSNEIDDSAGDIAEDSLQTLTEGLSEIDMDEEKLVATDPIRWFGVLVPQTLRQSQTDFQKAAIIAGEVCTLQSKLKFVEEKLVKQKKTSE